MSDSASYILNEYFILKLIFSYLPSKDLHTAAKVCRQWNELATRALKQNGEPQCCCVLNGIDIAPPLNDRQSPKIILDLSAYSPTFNGISSYERLLQHLHDTYYLENTSIYHIQADPCIFSWKCVDKSFIGNVVHRTAKGSDPAHCLMLLSNMPGVNIECFQEFQKRIVKSHDGTMANLESISQAKGVALIVGSRNTCVNQTQLMLDEVFQICNSKTDTKSELVLAGGITQNIRRIQSSYKKTEVLGLVFSGENVTVHTDLHIPQREVLEDFMKNLSERVGPIPENCLRLAFAFICINRKGTYRDITLFKQFFPGVLIYGFYSFGEYFMNCITGDDTSKKKNSSEYFNRENYLFTNCCSILILTIKKSKPGTS